MTYASPGRGWTRPTQRSYTGWPPIPLRWRWPTGTRWRPPPGCSTPTASTRTRPEQPPTPSACSARSAGSELVPDDPAQELARLVVRHFLAELDDLRGLGRPQALPHPLLQLLRRHFHPGLGDDGGRHRFAPFGIGNPHYGRFGDRRMLHEGVLDLAWREVLPAAHDDVVQAAVQ